MYVTARDNDASSCVVDATLNAVYYVYFPILIDVFRGLAIDVCYLLRYQVALVVVCIECSRMFAM